MELKQMTGMVTDSDNEEIAGALISNPKNGTKGLWRPDDFRTHPITPVKVTWHNGMWYSPMAYALLGAI